jgi:hypothetical protein
VSCIAANAGEALADLRPALAEAQGHIQNAMDGIKSYKLKFKTSNCKK